MTLKFTDAGLNQILNSFINSNVAPTAPAIGLFINNYNPTTGDTLANLTPANFPGYAMQALVGWGAPADAAHVGTITAAANTFTRNATGAVQQVYGYYVTDHTGAVLWWSERDPLAPIPMQNAGDSYTVTAKITAQDLSTP